MVYFVCKAQNEGNLLNSGEDGGSRENVKQVVISQDQYAPKERETTCCSYVIKKRTIKEPTFLCVTSKLKADQTLIA